jgi:hypothetical protein
MQQWRGSVGHRAVRVRVKHDGWAGGIRRGCPQVASGCWQARGRARVAARERCGDTRALETAVVRFGQPTSLRARQHRVVATELATGVGCANGSARTLARRVAWRTTRSNAAAVRHGNHGRQSVLSTQQHGSPVGCPRVLTRSPQVPAAYIIHIMRSDVAVETRLASAVLSRPAPRVRLRPTVTARSLPAPGRSLGHHEQRVSSSSWPCGRARSKARRREAAPLRTNNDAIAPPASTPPTGTGAPPHLGRNARSARSSSRSAHHATITRQ